MTNLAYDWYGLQKFLNDVLIQAEDSWQPGAVLPGCWIWNGDMDRKYGAFSRGNRGTGLSTAELREAGLGRRETSQRAAYRLLVGPIPSGFQIDHLCYFKLCVRPEHLEAVTIAENLERGRRVRKGLTVERGVRYS